MSSKKPKLGQNFLIDENACQRIADAIGDASKKTVVEIGPGHGAITDLLAKRCKQLHCIEFDPALARELKFRFRGATHVKIHHADILKTDLATLLGSAASLDVVGNLPYYITSDILLLLFAAARAGVVSRAVLMMQREVAERIVAGPGSSEYGSLSAATQMHAQATNLFTLPPGAFSPPPEVFSTVLRLEFAPRFTELGVDAASFEAFLKVIFAQKRKTLHNNLRAGGRSAEEIASAWPQSIPPLARAESLGLEPMAQLYRALQTTKTV